MENIKKTILTNCEVKQTSDRNGDPYFLIFDKSKENNNAFFAFKRGITEDGWKILINFTSSQLEIDYTESEGKEPGKIFKRVVDVNVGIFV